MPIETLTVGQLNTNCYLFYNKDSRVCFIIDPGDDGGYIKNKIRDLELKPQAILATHGHFDHVLAVTELKLAFNIPFYLHKVDLAILKRAQSTAKYFLGIASDPPAKVDKYLEHGQLLKFGKSNKSNNPSLKVMEVPGHTPGSVAFYCKKESLIFTGDLIFAEGGYGRTDLKGGDFNKLQQSIRKTLSLPLKTVIYSGHGEKTTVKKERKFYINLDK